MNIEEINALDLKQLKQLTRFSTSLTAWGWFAGIISLLVSFALPPSGWPVTVIAALSIWFFFTRSRSKGAKICAMINTLCAACLGAAVISMLVSIRNQYLPGWYSILFGGLAFCLFAGLAYELFRAVWCKDLWGENRITHAQIKAAVAARRAGIELTAEQLPAIPTLHPAWGICAIVMGYLASAIIILVAMTIVSSILQPM